MIFHLILHKEIIKSRCLIGSNESTFLHQDDNNGAALSLRVTTKQLNHDNQSFLDQIKRSPLSLFSLVNRYLLK